MYIHEVADFIKFQIFGILAMSWKINIENSSLPVKLLLHHTEIFVIPLLSYVVEFCLGVLFRSSMYSNVILLQAKWIWITKYIRIYISSCIKSQYFGFRRCNLRLYAVHRDKSYYVSFEQTLITTAIFFFYMLFLV